MKKYLHIFGGKNNLSPATKSIRTIVTSCTVTPSSIISLGPHLKNISGLSHSILRCLDNDRNAERVILLLVS